MKIEVLEDGVQYRVWAPAKLNLFFEVLGKRPDGYHDIETLVAPIGVYDRLDCTFTKSDVFGVTVECYDEHGAPCPDVPTDESNLVCKAFKAYTSEISKRLFCDNYFCLNIKIFKKISTKAGLGGGSSDASSILLVLDRHSGGIIPKSRLREIAGAIGSDVPLFLEEGASIGRGRGELVEPFELPEFWTTVVKPSAGLSTPEVYRQYSSTVHSPRRSLSDVLSSIRSYEGTDFAGFISGLVFNRLEEAASGLWDGVERWKSALKSLPETLAVQMTGSGSAFFALYPNETAAKKAAERIEAFVAKDVSGLYEVEDVFVAKTLTVRSD